MSVRALLLLALAIGFEVTATLALKASAGGARAATLALVVPGYALAFWLLGQSLRALPVGIAYALWAGLGTAGVAVLGWLLFGEALRAPALLGIAFVVAGAGLLSVHVGSH
jgi:small multidrug resistance pump